MGVLVSEAYRYSIDVLKPDMYTYVVRALPPVLQHYFGEAGRLYDAVCNTHDVEVLSFLEKEALRIRLFVPSRAQMLRTRQVEEVQVLASLLPWSSSLEDVELHMHLGTCVRRLLLEGETQQIEAWFSYMPDARLVFEPFLNEYIQDHLAYVSMDERECSILAAANESWGFLSHENVSEHAARLLLLSTKEEPSENHAHEYLRWLAEEYGCSEMQLGVPLHKTQIVKGN
eukprot:1459125-Pleurochrysis_carterae.AAC.1